MTKKNGMTGKGGHDGETVIMNPHFVILNPYIVILSEVKDL